MDDVEDLIRDQRGQAKARLVQQQKARLSHQRAADGDHLLLASRQGGCGLIDPLPQFGKAGEDPFHTPADLGLADLQDQSAQFEVLPDGQGPEHLPPLGAERQSGRGHS